jgi:L-alanine-DL-glutamate epimerase-like enolase superfamily enzyme
LEPIASLSTRMDTVLARNEFTKAGVNMGLWDALGHVRNQPVAQLLGGPFRSSVPTKISLSGDGDDLASSYETARAKRFSAFKVKVGFDVEADVARVALTRELVGADALLGIDANGGWTRTAAHQVMRRLRGCDLGFVEQPVAADDLDGLRSIRGHGVPVVADESVYSAQDLRRVERADACDAVSIYVGKSGSLERAAQSLQLASVLGLDGVIGSNGELGLGCAAQVHVACAVEKLGRLPGDIAGMHYYDGADVVVDPVVIDGVAAHLPTGPGLGVTIDPSIERGFS